MMPAKRGSEGPVRWRRPDRPGEISRPRSLPTPHHSSSLSAFPRLARRDWRTRLRTRWSASPIVVLRRTHSGVVPPISGGEHPGTEEAAAMLTDRSFPRRVATVLLPVVLIATGLSASVSVQAGSAPARAGMTGPRRPPRSPRTISPRPTTVRRSRTASGRPTARRGARAPAPGTSIANQQGAPLALIPYEAFGCLLQQFKDRGRTPQASRRESTYSVLTQTDAGRDQYGAVVNAMETPEQIEGYNNWVAYRAKALTDPHRGAGAARVLHERQDPDLHGEQHPWGRGRGRGLDDADHPGPRRRCLAGPTRRSTTSSITRSSSRSQS